MMKKIISLLFCSLLFAICVSHAQTTALHAQQLCMRNGLSHNTVNAIVQDSYGYIWIATPNGLNRYDGYSIKQYFHSLNDSNSLADNYINNLYCNKKGELLIFCRNGGITKYDYRHDQFFSNPIATKNDPQRLRKNNIHRMLEDGYGNSWIATDYAIARSRNGAWKWYQKIVPDVDLTNQSVQLLGFNAKNQILISPSLTGGVYYYELANDCFFAQKINQELNAEKPTALLAAIVDNAKTTQWFASSFDGLIANKEATSSIERYGIMASDAAHHIGSNGTKCLLYDYQQTLWVGMRNAGLAYRKANENSFTACNLFVDDKQLSQYSVQCLCSDAVHNLWLGTEDNGVFCVGYRSNQFKIYSSFTLDIGTTTNSNVSCMYEHVDKSLWLGTYGNGLLKFDTERAMAERFPIPGNGLIVDICDNSDGRFWVATWGGGVYLFDPVRGSVCNGAERVALQSYRNCKAILKIKNYLWIATHGQGIVIYDCKNNVVFNAQNPCPLFKFDMGKLRWASDLAVGKNGHIWIVANNGIFEYDGIKLIDHNVLNTQQRHAKNEVSTVFIDSKDVVWLGGDGFDRYDAQKRTFEHLNSRYKTLPNKVKAISEDKNGTLWLTGELEVVSFSPQNGSVRVFDAAEGMTLQQFNDRAIFHTSSDLMLIGSNTGLALFQPSNVIANKVVPQVVIQSCYILDTANGAIQGGLLPTKDILKEFSGDTLTLSYANSRFVGFDFVGINLLSSSKIQYAYRMEGFDTYWHYAGNERKASYTNLPPGIYQFKVKAANSDGFWNEKGSYLTIKILAPWWQRWWFIALISIGLLGTFLAILYFRTAQMKRINKRLEMQVEQRTQQLQEKTTFIEAQNNELLYKNSRIEEQNHELSVISDQVQRNNLELQYKNEDLESMTEELRVQSEALLSTNDSLTQTIATKDKLFSVIAHDLKNPFSGIISFIDLLQSDYKQFDDEKRQYFIGMIAKSSQTVFGLLTNLFNWARSQTGVMDAKPESFVVNQLFIDVKELQQHLAEAKSISIALQSDDSVVYADRSMMETVLRNLVHNAIKFTRPGGIVQLRALKKNDQIELQIIDSGVGIAPERMAYVFSPNQFHSSHGTDSEKGSGLGLLICKEFVELNHGRIDMQSVVEQGTICTILLPAGQSDAVETKPVQYKTRFESILSVREKVASKTRILVVDDSHEIRAAMVEHLEYYFSVKQAVDGEKAWQMLQTESFDLVVSDIMMAGIDGFELCNRIRKSKQLESIGVILITANTEEKNQIIGLNIGADAYLEKPFSMALLLSQVNTVLSRKRSLANPISMSIPDDGLVETTIEQETIDKINAILEQNFAKPDFGIEQLADIMCMSRSQLYRKMRLWYGVTPIEYLQRYRLQKSTELLKTGKYRMIDIACMTGFSCQQYFTTVFTKHFGISPSEYMRLNRKQES